MVEYNYGKELKKIKSDRLGEHKRIKILSSESGTILNQTIQQLKSDLKGVNIRFDLSDYFFQNQALQKKLGLIILTVLVVIYLVLTAQFESFSQPFIIFLTIPFGVLGSIVCLFLFGYSLNVMSGIGIVISLGILVNDSILKIDTANKLLKEKYNNEIKKEYIYLVLSTTSNIRLKPILMTSVTTILAVIPLLFYTGIAVKIQSPLIILVIGGLTFGTLASLYAIPLFYILLFQLKAIVTIQQL